MLYKTLICFKENKFLKVSVILILAFLLIVYFYFVYQKYKDNKFLNLKPEIFYKSQEEKDLYQFIEKRLIARNYGILTNYLNKPSVGDLPAGKEILSESVGLLMQYALQADSKSMFEKQFLLLKRAFITRGGLVMWKIDDNNKQITSTNALIDDLRISDALIKALERWGDKKYKNTGLKMAEYLLKHNIKGQLPVDYFDFKQKNSSNMLSIRYIDIDTMKKLSQYSANWKSIYENSEKILKNATIVNDKIFFFEGYNTASEKYENKDKLDTVSQLITMENSLRAGLKPQEALKWLKESFQWYGFVVSRYDISSKEPASRIESPAIYALCARIFYLAGDYDTAEKFYERMNIFKVTETNSTFFGGFAFIQTGDSFSFDNIQALLTIRYRSNLISNIQDINKISIK